MTKRKIFISIIVGLLLSLIFIVGSSAASNTCTKGHTAGKAATCTTAQTCTKCGTVIKAKLGHKYSSSYTVDKKATCTTAGSKSKHCTRSGCTAKTSVTTIKATGHKAGAAATCTTAQTCTTCKAVIKAKLGHKYSSSYTVDKKATCTAAGSKSKHCTRSGCTAKTSVTTIKATGHKAGAAATCTTAQTCTTCKAVIKAKLGHKYSSSYTVDKKATCTAAGSKSKHCTRSGCTAKTSVTTIKATGHKAGAAATCTTAQTCTTCKAVIKAKLGHSYSSTYTTDTKATCTAAGSKSKHCTRSGCTAKTSVTTIKATGHKAGAAATCTTAQTCTTCKAVIKAKLGHSYSTTYTTDKKATCTVAGSKSKHCTRSGCTAKTSVTAIPANGHTAGAAATCTTAQTCTTCKAVIKAKLGHSYSTSFTTDTKATCTTAGSKSKHCTRSGCTAKTSVTSVAATGHKAGAAATCTTAQTCTTCKAVIKAKLGHSYSTSFTTDTKATCTTAGSKSKHCTRSGCTAKTSVTSIAATGHTAGAEATCTTAQTCTVCSAVIKAKLGHSYSTSYTTDKKATCTTAGSKSKHCTRSGCTAKTSVTTIAAKGHTAGAAATCTTAQTCTTCKAVIKAKLGHTYTKATLIDEKTHSTTCDVCGVKVSSQAHKPKTEYVPATCTTDAYTLTCCELCSYSTIVTDINNKATGHTKKFVQKIPATCTEGGYDEYECSVCHAMLPTENHTSQLKHKYKANSELSYAATCTSPGITVMTCTVCGDRDEDKIIAATGHTFDQSIYDEINDNGCTTRNYVCANDNCSEILKTEEHCRYKINKIYPTCTKEGTNTYVCRGCGTTIKTETVAPEGHDLPHTIVPPTCTTDGSYSYSSGTCETCGEEVDSSEKIVLPATGHTLNIENPTCTLNSECTVKGCGYVKAEALKHDYSIANCEIIENCTGFYCNRCGNLLDTTKEKLDTYNNLLNKMLLRAYAQEKTLSFIQKEVTDITYTELDFGIYTSIVKNLFDESMQGTETSYAVYNNRIMYGNYKPLNLYGAASKLEESDIRSISVLTLSELKASSLFSDLGSQITAANGESFNPAEYANKTFKNVIKVTVNVKNEDLKSIKALGANQNPALSKLYAVNVKEDLADYLYGPKKETDETGFIMEIEISSLNTSGNATYYFDASTYEPIAAVYNINVTMSQHIDMTFDTGVVNLKGTMSPKETTTNQNIYLFSGFFAK